ncbi:SAM-dependent methyltransferase [Actinomadura luteofluorescens]|uniref:SAM-dependent methyltransferase n=1 Tax=Actinomadura luteofluorescens TaxID=46163 RepID=UPI00363A223E
MTAYGLLVSPSHNRVYAQAAADLVKAELAVFSERALGGRVRDIEETSIGGVPYVTFSADELTEQDVRLLSNLSSLYALFQIEGELLRPVGLQPLDLFGSDLLTIQKYSGKTNEYFTKLLLNVTAMATDSPMDLITGRPRVFDPMCGRGTTLNQAMMYGLDAAGMDIDGKDFDAYTAFIKTWLKNNRVKHQAEVTNVRREKAVLGRRLHVTLGASKERYKSGETMEITVVNADSLGASRFFRPASFDLIVTDAPYGVQHGSRPKGRSPAARAARSCRAARWSCSRPPSPSGRGCCVRGRRRHLLEHLRRPPRAARGDPGLQRPGRPGLRRLPRFPPPRRPGHLPRPHRGVQAVRLSATAPRAGAARPGRG